jgi:hypothetical protein
MKVLVRKNKILHLLANFQMADESSKKEVKRMQIPWRDPVKGPILKLSLMKMVVVKGIHLKKGTSDISNLWRVFIADLLRQPEWRFLADQIAEFPHEIFERTFKEAVKNITADVCRAMGWAEKGGTSGNLSGKEGDMDELSMQVRQTLMDLEKKKEEKESGKALQEDLNTN